MVQMRATAQQVRHNLKLVPVRVGDPALCSDGSDESHSATGQTQFITGFQLGLRIRLFVQMAQMRAIAQQVRHNLKLVPVRVGDPALCSDVSDERHCATGQTQFITGSS
jgi:predicted methyltransferase